MLFQALGCALLTRMVLSASRAMITLYVDFCMNKIDIISYYYDIYSWVIRCYRDPMVAYTGVLTQ